MDEFNFYKYIDEKSILVITPKGKLVRIRCPFAILDAENKILQVDAIGSQNNIINFKINGKYLSHHGLRILNE